MCGYNEFDKLKKIDDANNYSKDEAVSKPTGLSRYWPHYKESKWIAGFFLKQ